MTKRGEARRRHVPRRTCVACRRVGSPRELIRVVRLPTGAVEVDEKGKKSGRGAYLCPNRSCWEKALSKSLLEHALKTNVAQDEKDILWKFCRGLPSEAGETASAGALGG